MREYSRLCVFGFILTSVFINSDAYRPWRPRQIPRPIVIYGDDIRVTDQMGLRGEESSVQPTYVKYSGQKEIIEPITAADAPIIATSANGGYASSGQPEGNSGYQQQQGPNVDLVRQKQQEQQKYLDRQYQIQQQKEQMQMRQEQELKRIEEELLKEKAALEGERLKLSGGVQMQPAAQTYGPPQFANAPVYGPPPAGLAQNVQAYGPPAQEIVESVEPSAPVVVCDERQVVGRTRIIEVKTSAGRICKVKVMPYDRCPGSEPFELVVGDDLGEPEACQGVVNVLTGASIVGNTVSAIPGTVIRGLSYLVDSYDTVKDFYTDLYYKRQAVRANQDAEWDHVRAVLKH